MAPEVVKVPVRANSVESAPTWRVLLLVIVVVWQVYTSGRLAAYTTHLVEARDRHEELQSALNDAQDALIALRNHTQSFAQAEKDHAAAIATATKEKRAVQSRLEEVLELNAWLNRTASAREVTLREEQAKRLGLEGSVQSLKEQMNLMQGQLVTAQQQQGMLHGGRRKGKH